MRAKYKSSDSVADNNVWYGVFSDITFHTTFAPFTKDQGRAFISHYRQRYCSGDVPSEEAVQVIKSLEKNIDTMMIDTDDRGAFIRLNTRSPKDAIALNREKFLAQTENYSTHEKLKLFFDLSMSSLRVYSGKEAVELLLSSERVFVDVLQALDADASKRPEDRHVWDLEICVRQWEDNLREDLEFRGFVLNYELVGLSQYNTYVCHPAVLTNRNIIEKQIGEFFKKDIQPRLRTLQTPDSVVDIALLAPGGGRPRHSLTPRPPLTPMALSQATPVVIELNPFNRRTGAGLFTWHGEQELLLGESEGVDFRLVEESTEEEHTHVMLDLLLEEANTLHKRQKKVAQQEQQQQQHTCRVS